MLGLIIGCSQNAFIESAKRDTDSALIFEARKLMDASAWSEAIAMINRMSADGQANRNTKVTLASAYAGKCGLNLIRLAEQISSSAGQNFFGLLLSALRGANAASIAACVLAESTIQSISNVPATRTSDENVMMAFVGFAKIGAVLAAHADTNGDGTPDPSFDACDPAMMPEAMLREVGTGVTLAVDALAASGGSIGSGLANSVTAACDQLATIDPSYDFCTVTTTAGFSAEQVRALGGLVQSSDNPGLGTCAGNLQSCVCPP